MLRSFMLLVVASTSFQVSANAQQVSNHSFRTGETTVTDDNVRTPRYRMVADRFRRRFGGYRQSRSPSILGFGFGIGNYYSDRESGYHQFDPDAFSGYPYDPYRFGRFEAPDLLNDPYFRERNRYDSHFKSPLILKRSATPPAPHTRHRSHGHAGGSHPHAYGAPYSYRTPSHHGAPLTYDHRRPTAPSPYGQAQPPALDDGSPAALVAQLRVSCRQLTESLSAREDGEVWMEFLAPDRIIGWGLNGELDELKEIVTHYDGVAGSPEYKSVAAARGFAATRDALTRYLSGLPATAAESIPVPAPEPEIDFETTLRRGIEI